MRTDEEEYLLGQWNSLPLLRVEMGEYGEMYATNLRTGRRLGISADWVDYPVYDQLRELVTLMERDDLLEEGR